MRLSSGVLALLSLPVLAAADVTVEFWTSPKHDWDPEQGLEPGPNVAAYKILKQAEVGFGSAVNFEMNMYINSGDGVCPTVDDEGALLSEEARMKLCEESCINAQRYCEPPPTDPDHSDVTGSMIVGEALNRQCIWNNYHDNDDWDREEKYFEYVNHFREAGCDTKNFRGRCVHNALEAVGIDEKAISACRGDATADIDSDVLEEQIKKQAQRGIDRLPSLPAILINGILVEDFSEDAIFEAICNALPKGTIDVCDGSMSENLGEDENLEDEKEAEEELVEEIAQDLGESEEEVVEEVMGLTENGDFGLTDEEKKAITEGEEEELEELEEEEEELGKEAFEALDQEDNGVTTEANATMPYKSKALEPPEEAEKPARPVPEFPSETASPHLPHEEAQKGEETTSQTSPAGEEAVESAAEGQQGPSAESPTEDESTRPSLPSETSAPELEKVNSAGGAESPVPKPAEDIDAPNPPAPGEGGVVAATKDMDAFDLSLVDTALNHMEALQTCHVDTSLLLEKISSLANSGKLETEAEDIESDLPMMMSQNCPHEDGVEILHRLRNFHGCAMFDLQALIETFPSTAVGVAMRCANAYQNMTKEEEEKGYIPEACIRTIEASSNLGRGLFGLYLYPDVACPCFEKLGDNIPECTADVWPIPINGALLKVQSCLVGQYCKTIDGVCNDKMKVLNTCLPPRGTNPGDMQCGEIFDKCAEVYDNIHPMLNAAPLPDACVRIAQGSAYFGTHIVERYDAFRHQCGENIELWEGHGKVAEFKLFVTEGIYGIDYQSVPFVSGATGGFLAGVIFTIAFIIVRNILIWIKNFICNCCCCGRKNKRPPTKDYATVQMNGDEVEEYRDEP